MTSGKRRSTGPGTPGGLLWSLMDERGMTQLQLAVKTGRPQQLWSGIGSGQKRITADTALDLEGVFSVTAEAWLRLQCDVDLAEARAKRKQ